MRKSTTRNGATRKSTLRSLRRLAACVVVLALSANAKPAYADVFTLVVVVDGNERTDPAARGLRMAVDESPDVSHPPGREGGDHLGGVDVDLRWIRAGRSDTMQQVQAALDSGASAVVVLSRSATPTTISTAAQTRRRLTIVGTTRPVTRNAATIVLRSVATSRRDARATRFRTRFRTRFGSAPEAASLLGYDAGRMVDRLVADVGATLEPEAAVAAAPKLAPDALVGSAISSDPDSSMMPRR